MGTYNFDKSVYLEMEYTNSSVRDLIDKIDVESPAEKQTLQIHNNETMQKMKSFDTLLEEAENIKKSRGLDEVFTTGSNRNIINDFSDTIENQVTIIPKGMWFKDKSEYRFGTINNRSYWEV